VAKPKKDMPVPKPRPNEGKRPEKGGRSVELDSNRFTLICEELARTGSKYKACEALNFAYHTVQATIKEAEGRGDDSWRQLWDASYDQFRDSLEQEAVRRSRDGVLTPVFGKDGKVGEVQMYSDRLMEVLLKGHFPDRYRDKLFAAGTLGLEPVDAFANLSLKAKRQIREIIMVDLEEQRQAMRQAEKGQLIEGEAVDMTKAIEDMREQGE
jgi:hypothetical protein